MTSTVETSNLATATRYGYQRKTAAVAGWLVEAVEFTFSGEHWLKFSTSEDNFATQFGQTIAIEGANNCSITAFQDSGGRARVLVSWQQAENLGGRVAGLIYMQVLTLATSGPSTGFLSFTGSSPAIPTFALAFGFGDADIAVTPSGTGGMGWVVLGNTQIGVECSVEARQFTVQGDGSLILGNFQTVFGRFVHPSISIHSFPSVDIDPLTQRAAVIYNNGLDAASGGTTSIRTLEPDASLGIPHTVASFVARNTGSGDAYETSGITCRYDSRYQQWVLMGGRVWDGTDPWTKLWWRSLDGGVGGELFSEHNPTVNLGQGSGALDPFNGDAYLVGSNHDSLAGAATTLQFRRFERTSTTSMVEAAVGTIDPSTFTAHASTLATADSVHVLWTDGNVTPWNVRYKRIVLNQPPNAPQLLDPVGGVGVDINKPHTFRIAFSDPDPGDTIGSLNIRFRMVGTTVWSETGWVDGGSLTKLAPAGTFTTGNWEWQAATKDARGAIGPWSSSAFFTAGEAPTVVSFTLPLPDQMADNALLVEWVALVQDSYQLQRIADIDGVADPATVYSDTGEVDEPDAKFAVVTFDVTGRYEWLQLRVRAGGIWSDWVQVRLLVAFIPPGAVTLVVSEGPGGVIRVETTTHPGASAPDAIETFLGGVDAGGPGGTFP